LQASGVYEPKSSNYFLKNNRLGFTLTAISGDIFNIGSNLILNGDQSTAATFQRPLYIGRNTYRGPSTVGLDLRYTRVIPIKERFRAEFIAEGTNVFNRTNVTGVNTTATVNAAGVILTLNAAGVILTQPSYAWTGAIDQRLIQLGFRFAF
jgi:hypothetical protein